MLLALCTICTLQAADTSQPTIRLSQTNNKVVKNNKSAMPILRCLSPDVSYDIEDLQKHLEPLPPFHESIAFDEVVIEYGNKIAQRIVNIANIKHNESCLALLYKKLTQENNLKKLLKDKVIVGYSAKIYNKMRQDQQLIVTFSQALHLSEKVDGNLNIDILLEERRKAWRNFRLCGMRTLCDLRKEQLPKIQSPMPGPWTVSIEQFLDLNKDIVLTEEEQKRYVVYHVMRCALRQIHRTFDQVTDIVFRDDFDNL